jgi:aminoglycoside 3-N-acetyltransferase
MTIKREAAALNPILLGMRVPRDGVVVVHSAIARLSRKGFRADAMIETLLNYMCNGTVVMPTMTWRTVTPQNPHWDETETRSETGVLTEVFRTRYASLRSIHPTHSVAAYGAAAKVLVSQHHLDLTPVSEKSPYGLMRNYPTAILMIGVGLECCTAIHLPEEIIAPDVYLRPAAEAEAYECRDRHGISRRVWTRRHRRLDRDFSKFGPALTAGRHAHMSDIEGCPCMIVNLSALLNAVTVALHGDKNGTLKQGSPPEAAPALTRRCLLRNRVKNLAKSQSRPRRV